MKLKKDIKNIHIPGLRSKINSEKSMWQKSLLLAAEIGLVIFVCATVYLFVRPINQEIKVLIEDEVSSTNITFDKETLENLKNRQQPEKSSEPIIGKNPFLPF